MKPTLASLRRMIGGCLPLRWKYRLLSLLSAGYSRGAGVFVHPSVQILGAANVAIGDDSCISEHTWLNVNHRNRGEIAIRIGDNCFIGRRNFFSSGKLIDIGHYVLTTVDCKFVCSSHVIEDPAVPYIMSGTTGHETIRVGTNCYFGTGATVLGNVTIGHGSVIGANCLVMKDIPPFSMVVGNPARILRRYSFSRRVWLDANVITEVDLEENPDETAYLSALRNTHPKVSIPVIAAGADLGDL